ncbi:tetratricopeptide repeat protein [Cellulomonas sp. URHD0024]|uniref:tetratricopeptide repeat protein n=1 Tax=Cellulomonas sp. URHD0024 TaxID=1302620 RepID=UPI0004265ACF|nr:tetratricopeptide repeat protein [Cellulomonas sp. URHD0024]
MASGAEQPADDCEDPRAAFASALLRLRRRLPDVSDEELARRASATPLPSGRRVSVNARRLGEWLHGRSVPRDFDQVAALLRVVETAARGGGPGQVPSRSVEALRLLWRAARAHHVTGADPARLTAIASLVVGRPPSDAASVRARPVLSAMIDEALLDRAVSQVLLAGPGGAGKTQLAAAAFHRARARGGLLVWVPASSRQAVLSAYARVWRAIVNESLDGRVSPSAGSSHAHDEETQADLLMAWLRAADRPWLIVLDDLEDPSELDGLWPVGHRGHSIVTTRRRDAMVIRSAARVVPVGMFSPAESVEYLRSRLTVDPVVGALEPTAAELAALAEALGHFPLALSQAAAFLIDSGMEVSAYRGLVEDDRERLSDLFPRSSPADGHDGTVATTWRLAADRAAALAPPGSVRRTLELVAVLAPTGTPEQVLTSAAACDWVGGRPRDVLLALRALHRLSLLDHEGGVVAMHALVQRAVREALDPAAAPMLARAAADALEEAWAATDADPALEASMYDGVTTLRRTAGDHLFDEGMHPVLRRSAEYLATVGRSTVARDAAEDLLLQARSRQGDQGRDVVFLESQVARAIGDLGDPAGAYELLVPLRRRAEQLLGLDDPDTLEVRLHEARQQLEVGVVHDALRNLLSVVEAATAALGERHRLARHARRYVALCRGLSGDPAGACNGLTELADDLREQLGPHHPATIQALAESARWIGESGDAGGAVARYETAVQGFTDILGALHHETLATRHNLAYWRGLAGRPDRAIDELAVAAQDAERALGRRHPTTITFCLNLGYWRGMAGDPVQGRADLVGLQELVHDVFGPMHPRALRVRQHLAELRHRHGDVTGAVEDLTATVATMCEIQGPDHSRTREAAELLARWTTIDAGAPHATIGRTRTGT